MATPIISSSSFLRFFMGFFSVFLCLILCSFENGFALAARDTKPHLLPRSTHTVEVNSLLPATTCSPSTKGHNSNKAPSVLKVVHKHGPCSKFHKSSKTSTTTSDERYHAQILKQDQARVNSIHSRLNHNNNNNRMKDPLTQSAATTLPAKSGIVIGSPNYIVTVGLGTPAKQLSLIFDTGSDLTWTQCQPCAGSCYKQRGPIFDPSLSASYKNISCTTASCTQLSSSGIEHGCSSSTSACLYAAGYGDNSFTIGVFGSEKLTLTPTDVFECFLFGCGLDNEGLFNGSAGLLGLGRSSISLVEQTANKYNRLFSYCLPSTSSSTGHLTFGHGGSANGVQFTKLITSSQSESFYGLGLAGIKVGGRQLSIAPSVFSSSGTIIDSGTVITRLPATAYASLRGAFREAMKNYTLTKSFSLLDTCYDISGLNTFSYPEIAFVFGDGLTVDLDATGILVLISPSQVCLAFAGNMDDSDFGIIGNVQQKRLEVVYDVVGGKVGFGPAGCH
ncbi:PREDICTED: aspartyl protease family protein At5g10770-like [Prunus mume]|uniref:Aspartyl protease family protein At5g10770-like n=1 Tax=Prunus mume TaxID=102107 RepID=A0ABM0N7F1_PRUMU|nr:PREDICTED: aspartyl protease family protein At5g10770-like [Prunus mume]